MKFWKINGAAIRFCLLSLALAVSFAFWSIYLMTNYRIHFWSTTSDYTELSLAHGIGTDLWLHGIQDDRGVYQFLHPGIPLQFVSWITYRASEKNKDGGVLERAKQVLKNPEDFWKANRVGAMVIMCASILLACAALKVICRSDWTLLAVPSFFLYQGSPAFYSYFALTNECFTLLLGALISFLAFQFFQNPKQLLWPVLVGIVGGLAYLNKLNYICWLFSIFPASLFLLARKTISLKRLILLWLLLGTGFLSALLLIGIPWLGLDSFLRMLKSHFLVLEDTGYYGAGSRGFVNINTFAQNAWNLWLTAAPFLYLSGAVLAGSIMGALFDFRPCFQHRAQSSVPIYWIVWLILSVLLCTLAVLKHYQGHYFLVVCPMIVFLFGFLLSRSRLWLRLLFIGAIIFLIFPAVSSTALIYANIEKAEVADEAAFARVRALPIQDGKQRLWTYRVGAEEYGIIFVAWMANSSKLVSVAEALFSNDRILNHVDWTVCGGPKGPEYLLQAPWRYAVISRNVAGFYPILGDPRAHQPIPVNAGLVTTLFETDDVIVIERTGDTSNSSNVQSDTSFSR
jgi:hypothetical protein